MSGRGGVTYAWVSAPVLVTLILGVILLVVFVVWEWKVPNFPIVPITIFKIPTVVGVDVL